MNMQNPEHGGPPVLNHNPADGRLQSLDIFRGAIMVFLLLESSFLYENLEDLTLHGSVLLEQFFHAPWRGLRFWDLIQPGFMFIAGTGMALSLDRRLSRGDSRRNWVRHILKRSMILFVCGVALHWVYSGEPVFELQNVLTSLTVFGVEWMLCYRLYRHNIIIRIQ